MVPPLLKNQIWTRIVVLKAIRHDCEGVTFKRTGEKCKTERLQDLAGFVLV